MIILFSVNQEQSNQQQPWFIYLTNGKQVHVLETCSSTLLSLWAQRNFSCESSHYNEQSVDVMQIRDELCSVERLIDYNRIFWDKLKLSDSFSVIVKGAVFARFLVYTPSRIWINVLFFMLLRGPMWRTCCKVLGVTSACYQGMPSRNCNDWHSDNHWTGQNMICQNLSIYVC